MHPIYLYHSISAIGQKCQEFSQGPGGFGAFGGSMMSRFDNMAVPGLHPEKLRGRYEAEAQQLVFWKIPRKKI